MRPCMQRLVGRAFGGVVKLWESSVVVVVMVVAGGDEDGDVGDGGGVG